MEFSERMLVLQVGKLRESDLWVRLLSPSRGIISAFAFGGSRSRRRFVGCLDTLNEISVRITGSGSTPYLALQEGVLLKGLSRLRSDWARFGQAINCVRFMQSFGIGSEGAGEALNLMRETLQLLEETETVTRLLPLFFRMRLAFDQGYALQLSHCSLCSNSFAAQPISHPVWLFLSEGQLICDNCAEKISGHRISIGAEALSTLIAIHNDSPILWGHLVLSSTGARELGRAVDGFIQYHVGISWENGRFVRR